MKTHHSQFLFYLAASLLVLSPSVSLANSTPVYLEENGYIHLSAEDAGTTDNWVVRSNIEGYVGIGYLEWTGANFFSKSQAGNGTITYKIRIETAGNYELRWRSRIAKGESNTESNDSWIRFATASNVPGEHPLDGWTKVYMGEAGVWSWSSRTVDEQAKPVRQFFSQGDHTIEISGRSNGHAIDQIALYRYNDVNFDAGLNGTLSLSRYIQDDGTTIDPNPVVVPDPEPEPEPEIVLSERVNVDSISPDSGYTGSAMCVANTLTLPAVQSATLSSQNQAIDYTIEPLSVITNQQSVLLAYDLTQLPVFTNARLHYSTGSLISNGALDIYLGSHNNWHANSIEEPPGASVRVAEARGGWDANTHYVSALDASLLPFDDTTLILRARMGSDSLVIAGTGDGTAAPDLIITGGNNFCSEWEANVAIGAQTTEPENESTTTKRKSGIGAFDLWFGLLMLAGFSMTCRPPFSSQLKHPA